jgi:hypothetical protein
LHLSALGLPLSATAHHWLLERMQEDMLQPWLIYPERSIRGPVQWVRRERQPADDQAAHARQRLVQARRRMAGTAYDEEGPLWRQDAVEVTHRRARWR